MLCCLYTLFFMVTSKTSENPYTRMQCVFFIVVFFFLSNRGLTMKKGLFAVLHVFFFFFEEADPGLKKKKGTTTDARKRGTANENAMPFSTSAF